MAEIKTNALYSNFLSGALLLLWLSLLLGVLYPIMVTLLAHIFFPFQAKGSLLNMNGKMVGSELIGQSFTKEQYFWGRPSSTEPYPYNAMRSGGSNLNPVSKQYLAILESRKQLLEKNHPKSSLAIPLDLLTSSGSGLDPHISPEAAMYQISRILQSRQMPAMDLHELIEKNTEKPQFGFLGESRVNVLKLNIALDQYKNTGKDKDKDKDKK